MEALNGNMKVNSIVTQVLDECHICGSTVNLHIHHCIYGSGKRKLSGKYGLVVPLCARHHNMSNESAHFNKEVDLTLKRAGQKAFMKHYPNLSFIEIFGRNYL